MSEVWQPIFPLRSRGGGLRATSKMMQHDCEAAGIPYVTSDGVADVHANRVLFITRLCRSNVNLIMAQKLARHSDPKLTVTSIPKLPPPNGSDNQRNFRSMDREGDGHKISTSGHTLVF